MLSMIIFLGGCNQQKGPSQKRSLSNKVPFRSQAFVQVPATAHSLINTHHVNPRAEFERLSAQRRLRTSESAVAVFRQVRRAGGLLPFFEAKRKETAELLRKAKGDSPERARRLTERLDFLSDAILSAWLGALLTRAPIIFEQSEFFQFDYVDHPDISIVSYPPSEIVGTIEPGTSILLTGWHFGEDPGLVELTLSTTGQVFLLSTNSWSWEDDAIFADFPAGISAVPDQPAKLRVITSDNVSSEPIDVQFVAERELLMIDTSAHPEIVNVNPECFTAATEDACGGIPPGDPNLPEGAAFFGRHYRQCCSTVDGTDRYYIALKNNWALAGNEPIRSTDAWSFGLWEAVDVEYMFVIAAGWTGCTFFNSDGKVTDSHIGISSDPSFSLELDMSWHLDWACSGVLYGVDVWITGPKDLPYW
jgi:hypothetical protein